VDPGKLRHHGYAPADKADEEKMYQLALKAAFVSRECLEPAMEVVGKDACLLIQPFNTSDGLKKLDWKEHPCADSYLMKLADIFETRNMSAQNSSRISEGHRDQRFYLARD
jgi:hypothetical protein